MGTEIKPDVLRGIAVPMPLVTADAWEDSSSPSATATQAGRHAGTPRVRSDNSKFADPAMRLLTSGTPSNGSSLYVDTHRAGLPDRDEAGYLWREGTTGSDRYRGLDSPGVITGWEVIDTGTRASANRPSLVRTAGGKILAAWTQDINNIHLSVYDPDTSTWTTRAVSIVGGAWGVCLAVAPHSTAMDGERIYLYTGRQSGSVGVQVWFTDDGPSGTFLRANGSALIGTPSWVAGGGLAGPVGSLRVAISPSGQTLLLAWYYTGSVHDIAQYAATTPTGPFRLVSSSYTTDLGSGPNTRPECVALPGGGFVIGYHIQDTKWESARLSDAEQAPGEFEITSRSIAPQAANEPDHALWFGEDGRLWWLYSYSPGAGANRGLRLSYSDDQGEQWTDFPTEIYQAEPTNTPADRLAFFGAVDIGGRVAVLCEYTAGDTLACLWLGGHSDHTAPYTDVGFSLDGVCTAGDEPTGSARAAGSFLPIDTPGNSGWTESGAGSFATSTGVCVVTTTAGQTIVALRSTSEHPGMQDTANTEFYGEIQVKALTGTNKGTGLRVVLSDKGSASAATYAFGVSVRVGLDGSGNQEWELWDDVAGAQIGSTQTSSTTGHIGIRIALGEAGEVLSWWTESLGQVREWTTGPSSTGLSDDVASNPDASVEIGRIWGASAQTAEILCPLYCFYPHRWNALDTDATSASWVNPTNVRAVPYSTTWRYLSNGYRIRAEGGETMGVCPSLTTYGSDGWIIEPGYTYSRDHIIPAAYPSPAVTTRTEDNSAAVYSWALGSDTLPLSTSLALPIYRANVSTVHLQYWDGAALQTVGTLDLSAGLTSLPYVKDGDCLIIDAGGSGDATTIIQPGELRGATVKQSSAFAKVVDNSGGAWRADGATVRPILRMDDVSGFASSGTIDIWRRSGVLVVHGFATSTTHLAVTIPAHTNADGYFELGVGVPHEVFVFGQQYGKGRSLTTEVPAEVEYSQGGASRAAATGLGRRIVTFGWGEGIDSGPLFAATPDPAYVTGTDGGRGLAFPSATAHDLEWLLRRIGGASTPVTVLPRIPRGSGSHSLTESDAFIYGRVENTVDRQPFEGCEMEATCGEVARVEVLRVREIPGCWEI